MAKRKVKFTFPPELIKEPVIYTLGRNYKVITNIRRAEVEENKGWVILELNGEEAEIDAGINWVRSRGVRVDPVSGDIIEG